MFYTFSKWNLFALTYLLRLRVKENPKYELRILFIPELGGSRKMTAGFGDRLNALF